MTACDGSRLPTQSQISFRDMMMSSYLDMLKIHEQDDGEVVKRFINSVPVRFRESAVPRNDHRLQWLFNESA
jgi:hypothetical protein